jgi:isopenicillin-N N-acyltransferase-like protein
MRVISLVIACCCVASVAFSAVCPGSPNPYPLNTNTPILQKTVPNGKRFIAGQGNDTFYVAHVYGTPTEMGTAYGLLFKNELPQQMNNFYKYIDMEVQKALPTLPQWLVDLIAEFGSMYLLELTWNGTKAFTHERYIQEMNAIADAAGISREQFKAINMFPEAIKAACTVVGANGPSTMNGTLRGGIAHLRGLDFGVHPTIKDFPVVTVYHPSDGTPVVANFGWLAFVGALTAMTNNVIGLGEKVWLKSPIWNGSVWGEAWTFVNRDILRARNISQAISVVDKAKRTCGIHLGIGDSTTNTFRGLEVNAKQVIVFNDTTIKPYPQHPDFPGIMYWDKYSQPSRSFCLSSQLRLQYGKINASWLVLHAGAMLQTGDIHSASFDYVNQKAYFANAKKTYDPNGPEQANARQFTELDMKAIFNEPAPQA